MKFPDLGLSELVIGAVSLCPAGAVADSVGAHPPQLAIRSRLAFAYVAFLVLAVAEDADLRVGGAVVELDALVFVPDRLVLGTDALAFDDLFKTSALVVSTAQRGTT